ncbi:MAG: hypothetical protein HZB65_05080 [Candidatus Aenigmarchaeota archaeon]|nr:hypothetical protein [Candidatus Aenigmarchaeota archaeon]
MYKDKKGRKYIRMNELSYVSDVICLVLQFNSMLNFPISRRIGKQKATLLQDFIRLAKKELK